MERSRRRNSRLTKTALYQTTAYMNRQLQVQRPNIIGVELGDAIFRCQLTERRPDSLHAVVSSLPEEEGNFGTLGAYRALLFLQCKFSWIPSRGLNMNIFPVINHVAMAVLAVEASGQRSGKRHHR
jgi:hypothetical protein